MKGNSPSGDVWQNLEVFLIFTTWVVILASNGCVPRMLLNILKYTRQSPTNKRIIWSKMPIVLRLKNPLLDIVRHVEFSSGQLLSRVRLFATPWTAPRQASLSITNSQSLLKLMSIESVMPSKHLILCRPLLLLPSIFPSIRVFSNESVLPIKWPKY